MRMGLYYLLNIFKNDELTVYTTHELKLNQTKGKNRIGQVFYFNTSRFYNMFSNMASISLEISRSISALTEITYR